jgi:hypothetical protein
MDEQTRYLKSTLNPSFMTGTPFTDRFTNEIAKPINAQVGQLGANLYTQGISQGANERLIQENRNYMQPQVQSQLDTAALARAISEAGQTGKFNGQQTLQGQQVGSGLQSEALSRLIAQAGVTGQYNGQQTQQAQSQGFNQAQSLLPLLQTGALSGSSANPLLVALGLGGANIQTNPQLEMAQLAQAGISPEMFQALNQATTRQATAAANMAPVDYAAYYNKLGAQPSIIEQALPLLLALGGGALMNRGGGTGQQGTTGGQSAAPQAGGSQQFDISQLLQQIGQMGQNLPSTNLTAPSSGYGFSQLGNYLSGQPTQDNSLSGQLSRYLTGSGSGGFFNSGGGASSGASSLTPPTSNYGLPGLTQGGSAPMTGIATPQTGSQTGGGGPDWGGMAGSVGAVLGGGLGLAGAYGGAQALWNSLFGGRAPTPEEKASTEARMQKSTKFLFSATPEQIAQDVGRSQASDPGRMINWDDAQTKEAFAKRFPGVNQFYELNAADVPTYAKQLAAADILTKQQGNVSNALNTFGRVG